MLSLLIIAAIAIVANGQDVEIHLVGNSLLSSNVTFYGQMALFSPDLPNAGIYAPVWAISPELACSPLNGVPFLANQTWIALILRGECEFTTKVYWAQERGASVAIVYNNRTENQLVKMYSPYDPVQLTIPSLFISNEDGKMIVSKLAHNMVVQLLLVNPSVTGNPDQPNHWAMVMFISILAILVICFLILIFLICEVYRNRRQMARHVQESVKPGISEETLAKLPKRTATEDQPPDETCAICLEDFATGDEIRTLPCKHEFHCSCVDPWLLNRTRLCPVCKQDVAPETGGAPLTSSPNSNRPEEIEMSVIAPQSQQQQPSSPSPSSPHEPSTEATEATADG